MKILVAIVSSKDPINFSIKTVRWVGRSGYDLRVFVPRLQKRKYQIAVEDVNYMHYLDMEIDQIEAIGNSQRTIRRYAKKQGYDLVVIMRDNLEKFKRYTNDDDSLVNFCKEVGAMRKKLGRNKSITAVDIASGIKMLRV